MSKNFYKVIKNIVAQLIHFKARQKRRFLIDIAYLSLRDVGLKEQSIRRNDLQKLLRTSFVLK